MNSRAAIMNSRNYSAAIGKGNSLRENRLFGELINSKDSLFEREEREK